MPPNYFALIKLLFNEDVSKKIVLQMAYKQISKIGFAKVLAVLLSACTVGVSSFIRIPQIRKIIDPKLLDDRIKVANGLSLESYSIESFNYLIHVVFNSQNKNPFLDYGESLLMGIQNVIIILLIKFYRLRETNEIPDLSNKSWTDSIKVVGEKLAQPVGIIVGTIIFLTQVAPHQLISLLQVLNIPINIISKLPQIKQNHDLRTARHLSTITLRANVLGSIIRVFTSAQDLSTKRKKNKSSYNDWILLAGYITSLSLNSVLIGQSIIYDSKLVESKDDDDEEKKKV
ncbi:hypothetical protein DFJ63DRAFT_71523 [Scheffersomyces coipomensis]|uniref:uncharacterized protein n=1 Tax=Scheffersomyces coipomensis TaxID=1788519 RepID=UPI00315D0B00